MSNELDETQDLEAALVLFLGEIAPEVRRRPGEFFSWRPDDDQQMTLFYIVVSAGLMKDYSMDPSFAVTESGRQACFQARLAREALGLSEAPAPTPSSITFNNHAPVGAINTGAGGSAHGTVNVSQVDQAMHKLIELQDELGAQSDEMLRILRRLRDVESKQAGIEGLKAAVDDLEVKAFVDSLRGEKQKLVLGLLKDAAPLVLKLTGMV